MDSDGDNNSGFISSRMQQRVIDWDEGWAYIQVEITKLKRALDGFSKPHFNTEEQIMLYTSVYNMCSQRPNHSRRLYIKYRETLVEYITSTVLPSLADKHDEVLLKELSRRWTNHKLMVKWLSSFFRYLECYFIPKRSLPPLNVVGIISFRDLVYHGVSANARSAVIRLINKERDGHEEIDRALLKNIVKDMFVEIRISENQNAYEGEFEEEFLKDTSEYYRGKASSWIAGDSCPEYMMKVEECLRRERDRVPTYLHSSSEEKVVERVRHELLVVYGTELLENEESGFRALLRDGDDQMEHVSRVYRLYNEIPQSLEHMASLFKRQVISEGTNFVQEAQDDATRKIREVHDKCMGYVKDCFMNHSLFYNAVQEAFEFIFNQRPGDAGSETSSGDDPAGGGRNA